MYFTAGRSSLKRFRTLLEQARNEIWQKPSDGEDPIQGLHATASAAVRLTNPEHWPLVTVRREDGSEIEVRQFQPHPEEISA